MVASLERDASRANEARRTPLIDAAYARAANRDERWQDEDQYSEEVGDQHSEQDEDQYSEEVDEEEQLEGDEEVEGDEELAFRCMQCMESWFLDELRPGRTCPGCGATIDDFD